MKTLLARVSYLSSWNVISEGDGQGKRGGEYLLHSTS